MRQITVIEKVCTLAVLMGKYKMNQTTHALFVISGPRIDFIALSVE